MNLRACEDEAVSVHSMELLSLDCPSDVSLQVQESESGVLINGSDFVQFESLREHCSNLESIQLRIENPEREARRRKAERILGGAGIQVMSSKVTKAVTVPAGEGADLWFDVPLLENDKYRHYILCYSGRLAGAAEKNDIPVVFALENQYPNPFNPSTLIEFHVPEKARVGIHIYDAVGRLVADLADGVYYPGVYSTSWNGRNREGRRVTSGAYFCKMTTDKGPELTRKLILIR
ncbi:MAG: T9SS type A sorting domain-containing protein [bacterium]|nr:MAG: T9SS type A sorting domain-containing protein [bacterium]